MEGTDWARCIAFQIVEVRRGKSVGDTFKDVAEVDFHQLLNFVENATNHRGRRVPCKLLDAPVSQQIDVELRGGCGLMSRARVTPVSWGATFDMSMP